MIKCGKFLSGSTMIALLVIAVLLSGQIASASSTSDQLKRTTVRPVSSKGTVIVPDRYIRLWDPVTIFFAHDRGPASGPEDQPERYVRFTPDHPGVFTWLDSRTLQFLPVEPWPPLEIYTWKAERCEVTLSTLMSAPVWSVPMDQATDLEEIETISLTFPHPLDVEAIERMLRIEIRPVPGISPGNATWLDDSEYQIKRQEQKSGTREADYVITLTHPIPPGKRVLLHFHLTHEDAAERSSKPGAGFAEISFKTAEPFRIMAAGSSDLVLPIALAGTIYTKEQAMSITSDSTKFIVNFSSKPAMITPVTGANFIRITPAVENLTYTVMGKSIEIFGDFAWDTIYRVDLIPQPIRDTRDRVLLTKGKSTLYFFFPRKPPYLRWKSSEGIVERYGPKMLPMEGRGYDRADFRLYRIDPLDRSFWPFPGGAININEQDRPPGPGEIDKDLNTLHRAAYSYEIRQRLQLLGSPPVSDIIDLPTNRETGSATFGLNIEPYIEKVSGRKSAGTYLAGIRRLDDEKYRSWMRIQVTDLSLTTVEESQAVQFIVNSLHSGRPVEGATVRVEGINGKRNWTVFVQGKTNADGRFTWKPAHPQHGSVMRVTAEKDSDLLVLDPDNAPEMYADNQWFPSDMNWLQWTQEEHEYRGSHPEIRTHIFSERPVYRPEEPVHIKGYVRRRDNGSLSVPNNKGFLVVSGPGDLSWRYPLEITSLGSFYYLFSESNTPSGMYSVHYEDEKNCISGYSSFKKEAYRIPRFKVDLHGPDVMPLDTDFEISLTAAFYAGGRVSHQPIDWRISQYPFYWEPESLPGFVFASSARYSRDVRSTVLPRLDTQAETDDDGSAKIPITPSLEPSISPRRYVIEATVTGPDGHDVTGVHQVKAVPPFLLGLSVPRYLERVHQVIPQVVAVGPNGKPMPGLRVTVRMKKREWHSHLKAGDFSTGTARYITDIIDKEIFETTVQTAAESLPVSIPIEESGVYIVELIAHDRLGRAQSVSVDFYAGGDEPIAWSKPVSDVFSVSLDKDRYQPGDTARLILQSPFQRAEALIIEETPRGNRYEWVHVRDGQAVHSLKVQTYFAPRLPVHCILMRGRIDGTSPNRFTQQDLGKPSTMASTTWVSVEPTANQVHIDLKNPDRALPGEDVTIEIFLTSPDGVPLPGEVTLWLVDQAVMALGKEQLLDPLPEFLPSPHSYLSIRDTRNQILGWIPYAKQPGGGVAEDKGEDLFGKVTVRKSFMPVPYYNPAIPVGANGKTAVTVTLPDNITNFEIRAKAISGEERFGYAKGRMAVRLPIIVQPSLPRFVRPGDHFTASAIGRIVEGPGGPGSVQFSAKNVLMDHPERKTIQWVEGQPETFNFSVRIPVPEFNEEGIIDTEDVTFSVAVIRDSDKAGDAFEVTLPVRDDHRTIRMGDLYDLSENSPITIPAIDQPIREGSFKRKLTLTVTPGLLQMISGLNFLMNYPYGCTEQRISAAGVWLAAEKFRDISCSENTVRQGERIVQDTLAYIRTTVDENNLCGYWPGSKGYVSLTTWVLQFMVDARQHGYTVDETLFDTLIRTLKRSLRSDYGQFMDGEEFAERIWALLALTQAGESHPGYAAELARKTQFVSQESKAQILRVILQCHNDIPEDMINDIADQLWQGMIIRQHQGKPVFSGFQSGSGKRNNLILPSETRTLAETVRAFHLYHPTDDRLDMLLDALIRMSGWNGWGTTNANAAVLSAITGRIQFTEGFALPGSVVISENNVDTALEFPVDSALKTWETLTNCDHVISWNTHTEHDDYLGMRMETQFVPAAGGDKAYSISRGFAVSRSYHQIQSEDAPMEWLRLEKPGSTISVPSNMILEDHIQVVNSADRNHVVIVMPLASGCEPLNPGLAISPPESKPSGVLTLRPSYIDSNDDKICFIYDELPKGTYNFYYRLKAMVPGSYSLPPAYAEALYDDSVFGQSVGARMEIVDTQN
jgi:alpha-2-macroglobulin